MRVFATLSKIFQMLREPTARQVSSVAANLKTQLLRNWSADQISIGIRRVRVNEACVVSDY